MNLLCVKDGKLVVKNGNLCFADPDNLTPCVECCCPTVFHIVISTGDDPPYGKRRITFDLPVNSAQSASYFYPGTTPRYYYASQMLIEYLNPDDTVASSILLLGQAEISSGQPMILSVAYHGEGDDLPIPSWAYDGCIMDETPEYIPGEPPDTIHCPVAGTYIGTIRGWTFTASNP